MRWLLVLIVVTLAGCGPRPRSCRTSDNCDTGEVCERYFCESSPDAGVDMNQNPVTTDDAGTAPDAGIDSDAGSDMDAGELDAGFYCESHDECAPLKCLGHVCRGDDVDAGTDELDAGPTDVDAGFYCTSHDQCAPLRCLGHVCRGDVDAGTEELDAGTIGIEEPDAGDTVPDVDAGTDVDAGFYCTSHDQCVEPLKCRGHVCR